MSKKEYYYVILVLLLSTTTGQQLKSITPKERSSLPIIESRFKREDLRRLIVSTAAQEISFSR